MMSRSRRIPQRMCIGCRQRYNKRDLVRIVRTPEGAVVVDPTGKRSGRGAYLCLQEECLAKSLKAKILEKALMVPIAADTAEDLAKQIGELVKIKSKEGMKLPMK